MLRSVRENAVALLLITGCMGMGVFVSRRAVGVADALRQAPVTASPAGVQFGRVAQNNVVTQTIQLHNNGRTPLRVAHVTTSCGCTTTNAPQSIAPNASVALTVQFNARDKRGPIHQLVQVFFADHDDPIKVEVSGETVDEMHITPASLDWHTLHSGQKATGGVTLSRTDGKPLQITSIEAPSYLQSAARSLSASTSYISVRCIAPTAAGEHAEVLIAHTNDPLLPDACIPVLFTIRGEYQVSPDNANFGEVSVAGSAVQHIHITGADAARLQVLQVPVGFHAAFHGSSGRSTVLDIQSTAKGGTARVVNAPLVLTTANPKQPRIFIPIYAVVR